MSCKNYIISIDQGTTSTRAIIFNKNGEIISKAQRGVSCIFPKPSWVEVDALEIYVSVVDCINEALIRCSKTHDDIECFAIANQRETTVIWDKNTGIPVCNAIVWQSRQTEDIIKKYTDKKTFIHQKTGLLLNSYFSASKIRYILDSIPDGQKRAEKGELMFGTIDTWLIYKLTEGKSHYTDITNASRTMIYNIFTKEWDDELLKLFDIPKIILPKVVESSYDFGIATFFNNNIKILAACGDQQSALFGHKCFEKGMLKNTYGTGCFMLMNIGEKPLLSEYGLLTTIAYGLDGNITYALEGSVFIGGAVVEWLRNELMIIKVPSDTEKISLELTNNEGVYFVPAFVGLGTPYWDEKVRGSIFGLSRGSSYKHIVRASLESIAYQCKDVISAMESESSSNIVSLMVDGGASVNKMLMQFQSDLLQTDVYVASCLETTALGAFYLAGLKCGMFASIEEIVKNNNNKTTYSPILEKNIINKYYNGWKNAVAASKMYAMNEREENE